MALHFLEEALRNVRKHATTPRASVRVALEADQLFIDVENDGKVERSAGASRRRRIRLVVPATDTH